MKATKSLSAYWSFAGDVILCSIFLFLFFFLFCLFFVLFCFLFCLNFVYRCLVSFIKTESHQLQAWIKSSTVFSFLFFKSTETYFCPKCQLQPSWIYMMHDFHFQVKTLDKMTKVVITMHFRAAKLANQFIPPTSLSPWTNYFGISIPLDPPFTIQPDRSAEQYFLRIA